MKPALEGPFAKVLGGASRPALPQPECCGVSMTFLASEPEDLLMPRPRSRRQMPRG